MVSVFFPSLPCKQPWRVPWATLCYSFVLRFSLAETYVLHLALRWGSRRCTEAPHLFHLCPAQPCGGTGWILLWLSFLKLSQCYKREQQGNLPPSRSSSVEIPMSNCSYQKTEVSADSEFARHEYLHCNPAPRVILAWPGRGTWPACQENHTTPLQMNTYKNLPCTSTHQ